MNFSKKDIKQIEQKGITVETVERQIRVFENGLAFTNLNSAATIGDGIVKLNNKQIDHYTQLFESKKDDKRIIKFVPASGAATRMFKFLFKFLDEFNIENNSINWYINRHKNLNLSMFYIGIEKFPFFHIVKERLLDTYPDFDDLSINEQGYYFVRMMLDVDKLNYGNYPKGLLPFHLYKNHVVATAFGEHLYESAMYSPSDKSTELHFTISERHEHKFDEEFKRIEEKVEEKTGSKFDISFS